MLKLIFLSGSLLYTLGYALLLMYVLNFIFQEISISKKIRNRGSRFELIISGGRI